MARTLKIRLIVHHVLPGLYGPQQPRDAPWGRDAPRHFPGHDPIAGDLREVHDLQILSTEEAAS
jgi:hypothetical protein